ncbi:chemotaxis protein CheD [Nitrososphaera viennensis]|uniref:Probable chemoreceptor glutamine deamidase CheD n=2 Tax=Nitrososphaera viennensis TaxID=1034015 RepID=A0A060HNS2_9ARCH|nr:chemotaxis protein CheD [Nitrososphaera viennensis]AIC15216.1 chemoreceptor glutamine deamidase CheD [Nitrososphaera viennensis EN76]UVS70131.1 chemotaxis protein CheD [Nitrososphaera viennensis]
MDAAETSVGMGELHVADNKKDTVLTTFVGSCIALCLYDPQSKVGGMAHIMLPENSRNNDDDGSSSGEEGAAKYADEALENTLRMMVKKGALQGRLVAKIAGGAKIFSHEGSGGDNDMFSIGSRNAESIKKLLTQKGIRIAGEDVGLNHGRWVRFNLNSGQVVVSMRNSGEKIL